MAKTINVGKVTAYADAVAGGYQGTREEWEAALAGIGQEATAALAAKEGAEAAQAAAETAQINAEAAQTAAETAASAAATSAEGAALSEDAAAASATAAAGSAEDAQEVLESIPEDYSTLSNDVTDLKNAITISDSLSGWEKGAYRSDNGGNYANDSYIRTNIRFIGVAYGDNKIVADVGYQFIVYAWNVIDGTFYGSYHADGTFQMTGGALSMTAFDCPAFPNYHFKIALSQNPPSEDITPEEGLHLHIQKAINNTVTDNTNDNLITDDAERTSNYIADLKGVNGIYNAGNFITTVTKYNNTVIVKDRTAASDTHKYNLTGTKLLDISSSKISYNDFPEAYVDDIPDFVIGHLYQISITKINGSYTLDEPAANWAYITIRSKNGQIQSSSPDKSIFYCAEKPQAIFLHLRAGTYNCSIRIDIIDLTKKYALNADESYNLLQIFDKITSIGDSLMCGYTSQPSPTIDSATAKARGANWVSYIGSDIDRTIANVAVGGTSWHDWRYATNGADIETADIDTNCYLVGLGVNDSRQGLTIGTSADIAIDKSNNADSVYGNMDYVIRTLNGFNANAHIFLFTIPGNETNKDDINTAIRYIATLYSYVHCIDLDELYRMDINYGVFSKTWKNGHSNPLGYRIIGTLIQHAIDSYILTNYSVFAKVPYQY